MNPTAVIPDKEQIIDLFKQNFDNICRNDIPFISELRQKAIESFSLNGFPDQSLEKWKNTNLTETLAKSYNFYFDPFKDKVDIDKIFRCEIHNFETYLFTQLNGWYIYNQAALSELPNGVIVGSMAAAMKAFPKIMQKHYSKYADLDGNGMISLNTAFAQDGIFIYVPDDVTVMKPIQMVNIVNIAEDIFIQPRNLIVLGKNSKLTLVYCDDSIKHKNSFINSVTEVYTDEYAEIDFYKLQNKDDSSAVITNTFFHQEQSSRVSTNTLTFNGGLIRNETKVCLNGPNAESKIYGLYLIDKDQHVDNQVYIDHAAPNTSSFEQFKGIMDDNASAIFNGYIHVHRDAQKTEAFQSNKNILLTDTASINTKPFLEIYADDVKCSHGSTVGQLDTDALFYLKSRGICDRNAKMLLMYAFTAEIVNKIKIEVLRSRIDNMIVKRLKGELSICDQCVLHCKEPEILNFEIDMSKI